MTKLKKAPYSKLLNKQNPYVFILTGQHVWLEAKAYHARNVNALVLPDGTDPRGLIWPIQNCQVIIQWSVDLTQASIISLVKCLLAAGAEMVTVRPTWIDNYADAFYYDTAQPPGQRWVQCQEIIKSYYPRQAVA